jgi:hypothetical protein
MRLLRWNTPELTLTFAVGDGPVRLIAVHDGSRADLGTPDPSRPLVEVSETTKDLASMVDQ